MIRDDDDETRDSLLRAISHVPIFSRKLLLTDAVSSGCASLVHERKGTAWVHPAESSSSRRLPPPPRSPLSARFPPLPAPRPSWRRLRRPSSATPISRS